MRRLGVLLLCLGVILAGAASPARADSLTQLPASIVSPSMVVDPGDQHVFISGGRGQSSIAVLTFDGTLVKTITGEPGASQMAVDTSTHTLYVALYGADAISAIDTQTLAEKSRFSVSPLTRPESLVIAGGKVWFSNLNGYSSGYVATMNLDGSGVTQQNLQPGLPPSLYSSVQLSAGGANNGLLVTVQAGGGSSLYDVSSGSASQLTGFYFSGDFPHGSSCSAPYDFSVDPLGDYFLYASYSCAAVAALSGVGAAYYLPTGLNTSSVAWSTDGQYVAAADPAAIQVFPRGSTQTAWGWALGGGVAFHGLAFSPDGTHVFAIVGYNGGLGFQVLDEYTAPDTQITSGPASASTTYDTTASFSFSSHNAPATFLCNLDGSGWNACSSPQNLSSLGPGSHSFAVRTVVGSKTDPVGQSRTWTVQPPNTKITSSPGDSTLARDASFAFTSDDTNPVVFTCKLDALAWHACSSPTKLTSLAAGSHTFRVKAQDADVASDIDPVGATKTWTIQPGGQKLSVVRAGPGSGNVTSTPAGIACGSGCSAWYAGGTQVTLTAHPSTGSVFAGWSGACSGTGNCIVTMSGALSVTATFSTTKVTLTVNKSGSGTVASGPAGISCGLTCGHAYPYGTAVTLTATAATGSSFVGWSGACTGTSRICHLSMTASLTAKATFMSNKLLTVVKAGTGGGTVKSTPAGIACGSTCIHKFAAGTLVTLTATAKSGSVFVGWLGACTGTGNCVVTMSAAKTVKAKFTLK